MLVRNRSVPAAFALREAEEEDEKAVVLLLTTDLCLVREKFVESLTGFLTNGFVEMPGLAHFDRGEADAPLIQAPRASEAFVLAAAHPDVGKLASEAPVSGEAAHMLPWSRDQGLDSAAKAPEPV